ncbi:M56 family metallopeptidase [Clostridium butyricum]|uniref:M56 family metallopeptidase n=1 Tax=Clostridium butyricum TaxID=1492 RepID=UPI000903578E|nr:M56 family metallopeptidase [Clostridium butyricum]APF24919.1 blaR1 peptidase M56 family protein [Clostridium butyricum]
MRFLEQIFLIVFQTSLTAGIIILIIFAILKLFNNNLNIRVKYLLMSLILIRLIVPVTTQTNIKVNISEILKTIQGNNQNKLADKYTSNSKLKNNDTEMINKEPITIDYNQLNVENDQAENQINDILKNIVDAGAIIWCVGLVILTCMLMIVLIKFKSESNNMERIKDGNIIKILNKLKRNINLKSNINLYICDEKKSPCILGFIRPKIYLPHYVLELDEDMISHILLHELMHYKRKDLYLNFICWIILLLHWFNPLVWIALKKLKTYREYGCDCFVLQILGEEKNVDYGMTIINLSKIVTNKRSIQLGLGFERNNLIKGRIEMIKSFKNDSYNISAKAALGCLVAAVVVCTNGITVNALDVNSVSSNNAYNQTSIKNRHEFLVDSTVKSYDDLNKVRDILGFEFKLPDYSLGYGALDSIYQVIKISDDSNVIDAHFRDGDSNKNLTLEIFKDDPVEALSKIYESHNRFGRSNSKIEASKEQMNVGSVYGNSITLKITTPERTIDNQIVPESIDEGKYFVWENDGIFYAIPYANRYEINGQVKQDNKFENEELDRIASSLKNIDEIKDVDYLSVVPQELSTETGIMNIYDKDDLNKAQKILGFNPKMPLTVNSINIQDSMVGITSDSDVENNNINYELNNFYKDGKNMMTFSQSKHDTFNRYTTAKDKGYIYVNEININTEKIYIDGNEVYRDLEKDVDQENSKETISVGYFWQKDGIYYTLTIFNTDGYHDEIAKEFINSKTID